MGTPEGQNAQRIRRTVIPWAAVALLTAMAAAGASLGVLNSPSFTTTATPVQSPGSPLPFSPTTAATATTTQPSLSNSPAPEPITVNASAWQGHGNLAFISSGQLEILSTAGTLTEITGPTGGGFDSDAAWSSGDQWLAFLHTGPANGYDIPAPTLWLLKAGSSQAQEVTASGIGMFTWSPTAPVLAYTIVPKYNFPAGGAEDLWIDRPGAPPTSVAVGTGASFGSDRLVSRRRRVGLRRLGLSTTRFGNFTSCASDWSPGDRICQGWPNSNGPWAGRVGDRPRWLVA